MLEFTNKKSDSTVIVLTNKTGIKIADKRIVGSSETFLEIKPCFTQTIIY